jgi:hypothetical protein
MKKSNYIEPDETNDFGFSFAHEHDIVNDSGLHSQISDLKNRLYTLDKMFSPLLENLAKDSDKPMIKWPNRKDILEKQLKKLKDITNV